MSIAPSSIATYTAYEPVIGLEVHVQLLTASKIFCSCSTRFRRCAQHECLPGVPGHAGSVAGAEPEGGRVCHAGCDGAELPHQRNVDLRAQDYFYPDLPKATRFRNTTSRWPSMDISSTSPRALTAKVREGRPREDAKEKREVRLARKFGITRVHLERRRRQEPTKVFPTPRKDRDRPQPHWRVPLIRDRSANPTSLLPTKLTNI